MCVKDFKFSNVGISGYSSAMDSIVFKSELVHFTDTDIEERATLLNDAISQGVNFFDISNKNELRLLALVWDKLTNKENLFISITTPSSFDISFDDWLDESMRIFPYKVFDAIIVKNITKVLQGAEMEEILRVLNKRKVQGDFKHLGLRSKKPVAARSILEKYPDFEMCFLAYNYYNKSIEKVFDDYNGPAKIIALYPLNWWEANIPVYVINNHNEFHSLFGFEKTNSIIQAAYKYVMQNPSVYSTIVTLKNEEDLENVLLARSSHSEADTKLLKLYLEAASSDNYIALLSGALKTKDFKIMYEAVKQLYDFIDEDMPIKDYSFINSSHLYNIIMDSLFDKYVNLGYEKYFS